MEEMKDGMRWTFEKFEKEKFRSEFQSEIIIIVFVLSVGSCTCTRIDYECMY